jgi:hypothetical protein
MKILGQSPTDIPEAQAQGGVRRLSRRERRYARKVLAGAWAGWAPIFCASVFFVVGLLRSLSNGESGPVAETVILWVVVLPLCMGAAILSAYALCRATRTYLSPDPRPRRGFQVVSRDAE